MVRYTIWMRMGESDSMELNNGMNVHLLSEPQIANLAALKPRTSLVHEGGDKPPGQRLNCWGLVVVHLLHLPLSGTH